MRRSCARATAGPGYVWHCHIIEHEMMRTYKVIIPFEQIPAWLLILIVIVVASILGLTSLMYPRKRGISAAT